MSGTFSRHYGANTQSTPFGRFVCKLRLLRRRIRLLRAVLYQMGRACRRPSVLSGREAAGIVLNYERPINVQHQMRTSPCDETNMRIAPSLTQDAYPPCRRDWQRVVRAAQSTGGHHDYDR